MTTFCIYGTNADLARKILGRACFLSKFEVHDFYTDIGFVKIDKKQILTREMTTPDFLLVLDKNQHIKPDNSSIVVINSPQKVIYKSKAKCHYIDADKLMNETKAELIVIMLGALTKVFNKVSIKNMKETLLAEGLEHKGLEEGYKAVK